MSSSRFSYAARRSIRFGEPDAHVYLTDPYKIDPERDAHFVRLVIAEGKRLGLLTRDVPRGADRCGKVHRAAVEPKQISGQSQP